MSTSDIRKLGGLAKGPQVRASRLSLVSEGFRKRWQADKAHFLMLQAYSRAILNSDSGILNT